MTAARRLTRPRMAALFDVDHSRVESRGPDSARSGTLYSFLDRAADQTLTRACRWLTAHGYITTAPTAGDIPELTDRGRAVLGYGPHKVGDQ